MSRRRFVAFATMTCSLAAQGFALAQQTNGEIPQNPQPTIQGTIVVEPAEGDAKPKAKSQGHITIRTPDGKVRQVELPLPDSNFLRVYSAEVGGDDPNDLRAEALPKYVIGVSLSDVPPALRAHLTLPEGVGVMLGAVVLDSPAAQAGLQTHDIILKSGERDVKSAKDLQELVDGSDGKAISVTLFRKGEQQTVEMTPVKREELKFPETGEFHMTLPGPGAFLMRSGDKPPLMLHMAGGGPIAVSQSGVAPHPTQMDQLTQSIQKLTEQIERLQKSVDRLEKPAPENNPPPAAEDKKAGENGAGINTRKLGFISLS